MSRSVASSDPRASRLDKKCPPRSPKAKVCPSRLAILQRLLERACIHGELLAALRARHAERLLHHGSEPYTVLLGGEPLTYEQAEDLQWAIVECLEPLMPDDDAGRMRAVDVSEAILRVLGEVWTNG